jgi:hypothetical protein
VQNGPADFVTLLRFLSRKDMRGENVQILVDFLIDEVASSLLIFNCINALSRIQ